MAVLLATVVLSGCTGDQASESPQPPANLFADRAQTLVVNPRLDAAAMQADADGDTVQAAELERLAAVPTGVWLTPEQFPAGQAGPYVTGVVDTASAPDSRTVPVFVIYGIPDRDCTGGFSAGGLTPDTYLPWVQEIATAAGQDSVVVLEPDALAGTVSCDGDTERIRLLSEAAAALDDAAVTTYLDAGHSAWIPAPKMARLLKEVGIDEARGFATNVANYQPLARETAYAAELSGLLDGAHYVIDTGRNGDPAGDGAPVDDWCNPVGRALGQEPGYVDDGTSLDALLWIKPPAESDGTCHGGPPAGEIWIPRAISLAASAGW